MNALKANPEQLKDGPSKNKHHLMDEYLVFTQHNQVLVVTGEFNLSHLIGINAQHTVWFHLLIAMLYPYLKQTTSNANLNNPIQSGGRWGRGGGFTGRDANIKGN